MPAAEGEELPGEGTAAVGGFLNIVDVGRRAIGPEVAAEQFAAGGHDSENVVEVMGYATGQPSDRLHFFAPAEACPPLFFGQ